MKIFFNILHKLWQLTVAAVSNGLTLGLILLVILATIYVNIDSQLPDVEQDVKLPAGPLRVYTADGQLIQEFGPKRHLVDYADIPPVVIHSFLAAEDERFFQHHGVDVKGLMRAGIHLLKTGRKTEGGSTITMQLARHLYLTPEQTFLRKTKEILLAFKLERKFTKQQILTLYLNQIYLGSHSYGIAAAAHTYFGKNVGALSLSEAAMIAGLPKAPSSYTPLRYPKRAQARRRYVLGRMVYSGKISRREYDQAVAKPIVNPPAPAKAKQQGGYIAEMVRRKMLQMYGPSVYTSGFKVYVTVDSHDQVAAQKAVRHGLLSYDQRHNWRQPRQNLAQEKRADKQAQSAFLAQFSQVGGLVPALVLQRHSKQLVLLVQDGQHVTLGPKQNPWSRRRNFQSMVKQGDLVWLSAQHNGWRLAQLPQAQSALVAMNPNTGAIQALVGGFDFEDSQFNRATDAYRQTGSAIKPFIYGAALAKGYTAASLIDDAPVVYGEDDSAWRPRNYGRRIHGPTRLREGLVHSRNLMTIRLLRNIGIGFATDYMAKLGLPKANMPRDLTLALGSADFTPLQMATAYSVIANGGYKVEPFLIAKIVDHDEHIIFRAHPKPACRLAQGCATKQDAQSQRFAPQVISSGHAFIIADMLTDVIERGTGRAALTLGRKDLAGKTGTTNNMVDAWFSGFTPNLVTVNWIGFDQPMTLGWGETGAQAALPMWIDFMAQALKDRPIVSVTPPKDVVAVRIDRQTGHYALDGHGLLEYFINGSEPTRQQALEYKKSQPVRSPDWLF